MNHTIILRNATRDDCRFIWELANDPLVRAVSFSSDEIPWEDHQKWFNAKLHDSQCLFYIAEDSAGKMLGQMRFELKNEGWVISLSIVQTFRGKGVGADMIKAGSRKLFDSNPEINKIHAYIKNENIASIHVFEKSGYKEIGPASINNDNDAVLMILERTGIHR